LSNPNLVLNPKPPPSPKPLPNLSVPPSEPALLDRVAERAARGLSARTTRRSLLGRVGDKLLLTLAAPPTPKFEPLEAQNRPSSGSKTASPPEPAVAEPVAAAPAPATAPAPAKAAPEPGPPQPAAAVDVAPEPIASQPGPPAAEAALPEPALVVPEPAAEAPPESRPLAAPEPEPEAAATTPDEPTAAGAPVAEPIASTSAPPPAEPVLEIAPEPEPVTVPAEPAAEAPPESMPPAAEAPVPEPIASTSAPSPAEPEPTPTPTQLLGAPAPPPPTPPTSTTSTTEPDSAVGLPADPVAATVAISRARFTTADAVVLARADALTLAIAAPLAAALDAPVLAVDGAVDLATSNELNRLGAKRRLAVGLEIQGAEPVGQEGDDLGALSIAVADLVRQTAGTVRAFAIGDSEEAKAIAGPVAAAAAVRKFPVMIGAEAARHGATDGERRAAVTYLVGQDVIAAAATVPGGFPLPAPSNEAVVARLAQLLRADRIQTDTAAVTRPDADPATTAALAGAGGPVLYEAPEPPPATVFKV
jgi:hypothetical protein